jgi:hypothetical protein
MKYSPYIYEPDKSIEVYKKTEKYFKTNPETKRRIQELGWIYHTVRLIIPQTTDNYWSGHSFPLNESWDELQISFTQICLGLYKQAFTSLRSGLELGLLSVYFNINDDGHNAVKEWNDSEVNTPKAEKIWTILLQNDNIRIFNEIHDIKTVHKNLGYLHNYVHTKGKSHSNSMGLQKSNSQTFEEDLILKWLESYADVISLVSTLHLLKYPISVIRFDYRKKFGIDIPNFGGLEEFNIDKIASILPAQYLEDIERIAKEDPKTKEIIKEINNIPDITEEQVEEQIIKFEKIFIEHGEGFTKWLERQEKFLKSFGINEFDDKTKIRIELLRQWAIENNFLEPQGL